MVAFASVVWLHVAIFVLRGVAVAAVVLAAVWCAWLVTSVWWGHRHRDAPLAAAVHGLWARAGHALTASGVDEWEEEHGSFEPDEPEADEPEEAAVVRLRSSAEALTRDLARREERRRAEAERLLGELSAQVESLRAAVARIERVELEVSRLAREPARARDEDAPAGGDPMSDPDLQAAFAELDADLRLEKIEEREQLLGERERRLDRRERELTAFAAATQSRLA